MHSTDNSVGLSKNTTPKYIRIVQGNMLNQPEILPFQKLPTLILLDPDEYLNKTLKKELKNISARSDVDYVHIPRKNIILGKWFRHSNWWPDYVLRFFKRGHVDWKKEIHSQPVAKGNNLNLLDSEKLALRHNNYTSLSQFVHRALRYSSVQADELHKNKYQLKTSDFILKPIQEFNSRFF